MYPILQTHKGKITLGGLLLASTVILGPRGTYERLAVGVAEARELINDHSSPDHLLKVGRQQLATAEERLIDAEAASKGYRKQADNLGAEIGRLQNAISVAKSRLELLRPALTSGGTYQHGSCQFSPVDVRGDATELVAFVKQREAEIAAKQAALKDFQQILSAGDGTLEEARSEFAQAQTRFRELEVGLQQQQALQEATGAARAARSGLSAELGGDFAGTLSALEKRLNRIQRQNERLRGVDGAVPSGKIPFERQAVDPLKALNEVLGTSPATAQAQ